MSPHKSWKKRMISLKKDAEIKFKMGLIDLTQTAHYISNPNGVKLAFSIA